MIESFTQWICDHSQYAHLIFFFLLLLAGLNIPISEDIILLAGGMISATCIPEHSVRMWIWLYLGCIFSAWEAYWLGRKLGPKLYHIRWFSRFITPSRVEKLHFYYEKYGIWTFIIGRFLPGGVRNGLFITSGLGKMPFGIFLLRDCTACLFSTLVLFSLGHFFAENWSLLYQYFKTFDEIILSLIFLIIISTTLFFWRRKKMRNPD